MQFQQMPLSRAMRRQKNTLKLQWKLQTLLAQSRRVQKMYSVLLPEVVDADSWEEEGSSPCSNAAAHNDSAFPHPRQVRPASANRKGGARLVSGLRLGARKAHGLAG